MSVLPAGIECIEGQDNRVPEPEGADFVVMTTIRRERLGTNVHVYADCAFVGSIVDTTLTVTEMQFGVIEVGNTLFGPNVAARTSITAFGSGTGGTGTYTISPAQTVVSETMACGVQNITQKTEVTIQLDFHSANVGDSADMAQTVSTLFRDTYATSFFHALGTGVSPLLADDPRQMPFVNAEQQYETRWIVEAVLQADQVIENIPQQFAAALSVKTVEVSSTYPP